jgi:polysaccharide biosynthesis PFTS motif protein
MDLSKTLFSLIVLILRKRTGLKLKARYLFYSILEFCVWTNVESERRIQFITTQSSWSNLPIPFYLQVKNLERHMMWYSTNSIPILKIGEIESKSTLPQSLATYVDMHLVWDDLQVNFFKSQKIYNSRVFGSMLFYPRVVQKMPNKTLSLIYFDVIPQNLFETSFYNTESALNNLESIISVIDEYNSRLGKNLRLKVKHKRTPTRQHSKTYLKRVRNLSDSNLIEIISPSENLYKLIGESKFIIGTPYTSPVIIAKELGVESSFVNLWPSDYLIPDFFNEVPIIKLKDELLKKLLDLN